VALYVIAGAVGQSGQVPFAASQKENQYARMAVTSSNLERSTDLALTCEWLAYYVTKTTDDVAVCLRQTGRHGPVAHCDTARNIGLYTVV